MNFSSKTPALIVAAGISLTAMGAASSQPSLSDSKVAQIRQSLASAKLVEAPYRAAHLVAAAPKAERSAVARAAVEEVLAAHPTAVSATVRAVLTVAPDEVVAVMEGVMEKSPAAYKVALAAVKDMNPGSISSAVNVVSARVPSESQSLALFSAEASPVAPSSSEFSAARSPKAVVPGGTPTVSSVTKTVVRPPQAKACLYRP